MAADAGSLPVDLDRLDVESIEWLRTLGAGGSVGEDAVRRLHATLLRIARNEVQRRGPRLRLAGPELDDIAHQAAADATLSVTGKLEEFRGESRFTTWAYAFVVFEVSAKIGRHFWRTPGANLDAAQWERLPAAFGLEPEQESAGRELLAAVRHAVEQDLTAHQREVFVALVLNGVPLDALAVRLSSSRNALYKTMFDARRRLRAALVAEGYLPQERRESP